MKKYTSKESQSSLASLGLYQIFGGCLGILVILWSAYKSRILPFSTVALLLIVICFFGYSILCGLLCLKLKESAIKHSYINQFLQVIAFAAFGFAFEYIAGISVYLGIDLTESFDFSFGAGISGFAFNINHDPEKMKVTFNLLAIGVIYWIDTIQKKIKKEEKALQIAELIQN